MHLLLKSREKMPLISEVPRFGPTELGYIFADKNAAVLM